MMEFIGTKKIRAQAMTRLAYNILRGWNLPENENGEDEGYLVEYLDGGKPNMPGYAGYVSWSPKAQFDAAYRPCNAMNFGLAIEAMRDGFPVARAGWNGKGMWLAINQGNEFDLPWQQRLPASDATNEVRLRFFTGHMEPHIFMKTADGKYIPWLASQTDMLATDWCLVDMSGPVDEFLKGGAA